MDPREILKDCFGYDQFRPGQEKLIRAILSGRDVLGVMPTGGGKSLCYQVPALLLPGITLVISPLISLMKDQVSALTSAGVPAAFLNSSLTGEQLRLVYQRARQGQYKLLYAAPERLAGEGLLSLAREAPISLVAVDEAHCISQWGQDFRPSYLKIAGFAAQLPRRPVVAAFTATATAQVQEDILRLLAMEDPVREVTGFDRPNLYFDVQAPRSKRSALLSLLQARRDRSGIVYCATRSGVEKVWAYLQERGFSAARYHAGLDEEERRQNQDDFQFDRKTVMVATNAFGMGIDKSNVSYVIHYNMPKSLEAYYQEAGRAGRDGSPADCILLYSAGDVATARYLLDSGGNEALSPEVREQVRRQDQARLEAMVDYCKTSRCLRGCLLDYFGQAHGETCGHCGNCQGDFVREDVTVPAQMVLSCILRVKKLLGYYVGRTLILQVLRGSRDRRVLELRLDRLSTYGLMKDQSAAQLRALADFLELAGYVRTNPLHSTWEPAPAAAQVLFHGEAVFRTQRRDRAEQQRRREDPAAPAAGSGGLYEVLRGVRLRLAQREQVPAYVIFSNATLARMAEQAPRTREALLEVPGVGQVKAARYGEAFLRAIGAYLDQAPPEQ